MSSACRTASLTPARCEPSIFRRGSPSPLSLADGIGVPEPGTVRISDLASIVGPLKQPVGRDLYFTAKRTLSECARLARINGSCID